MGYKWSCKVRLCCPRALFSADAKFKIIVCTAFREGQKGKKSAAAPSAAGKGKGKEKSGPTISIPPRRPAGQSAGESDSQPDSHMELDGDVDQGVGEQSEVEPDVTEPGEDEEQEEEEEDEESEGDEVENKMVIDEEQERRDALGVTTREVEERERREQVVQASGVLGRKPT
jgi:hypothetical protein